MLVASWLFIVARPVSLKILDALQCVWLFFFSLNNLSARVCLCLVSLTYCSRIITCWCIITYSHQCFLLLPRLLLSCSTFQSRVHLSSWHPSVRFNLQKQSSSEFEPFFPFSNLGLGKPFLPPTHSSTRICLGRRPGDFLFSMSERKRFLLSAGQVRWRPTGRRLLGFSSRTTRVLLLNSLQQPVCWGDIVPDKVYSIHCDTFQNINPLTYSFTQTRINKYNKYCYDKINCT